MPLIEYGCKECGADFEALQLRAENEAPPCPKCQAVGAERRLSVFAVSRSSSAQSPGPCGSEDCACRKPSS